MISRDVVFDEFSSGVCGNVGVGNTLDTDEDFVSLDIESDNNPSDNAPSSETVESESGEYRTGIRDSERERLSRLCWLLMVE